MLSKRKCHQHLSESGIGVLLTTFYQGFSWEFKKLLYLIFIQKLGYPPSPLMPLILTKETIYLPFLLLILMKMNMWECRDSEDFHDTFFVAQSTFPAPPSPSAPKHTK